MYIVFVHINLKTNKQKNNNSIDASIPAMQDVLRAKKCVSGVAPTASAERNVVYHVNRVR